jgi:hypothetical protein
MELYIYIYIYIYIKLLVSLVARYVARGIYFIFCGRSLGPVLVIAVRYWYGGVKFLCSLVSGWISVSLVP